MGASHVRQRYNLGTSGPRGCRDWASEPGSEFGSGKTRDWHAADRFRVGADARLPDLLDHWIAGNGPAKNSSGPEICSTEEQYRQRLIGAIYKKALVPRG